MGKKLKRDTSNKKKTHKDLDKENISKKNNKPVKIKDQKIKFKNKPKKSTQNLKQKLKKLHKNGGSRSSLNIFNSNIADVTNIGKKVKDKKMKVQNKGAKNQDKFQKNQKNIKQKNQSFKQTNIKKNNVTALGKQEKSSLLPNSKEISIGKHKKTKKQKQIETNDKTGKEKSLTSKKEIKKRKELPVAFLGKSNNPKMLSRRYNLNLKKLKEKLATKDIETNDKIGKVKSLTSKKEIEKRKELPVASSGKSNNPKMLSKRYNLNLEKLKKSLAAKEILAESKPKAIAKINPLRERMMSKLKASRFRYLNETMYNNNSLESKNYFKDDPDSFKAYHEGYKQQIAQWPLNPLDVIISSFTKMPKDYVIADFGCGEARLSTSVTQKVHSFDFISLNENVTACDMAHTPLLTNSVHVVVFCLSLMGSNLKDYIIEANRILKQDGILKIAEVESRFDSVEDFIKVLSDYGFQNILKDLSHNLFYFLDFKKQRDIGRKRYKLSPITLKSCLYKKR
nr:ribosomal RNA-processing protein 8 [Megalopta genalis]